MQATVTSSVLVFLGFVAFAATAFGQNVLAAPIYGTANLDGVFTPDPYLADIDAGGTDSAEHLGDECAGYISNESPNYDLNYMAGDYPLGIYVESSIDTTLVVNDPRGNWYCNDDFSVAAGLNPGILFETPESGNYNIWVGTYQESDVGTSVRLVISEIERWLNLDTSNADFGDDSGRYSSDGECDDPRFSGTGMAAELLEYNRLRNATDCQGLFEQGQVALATAEQPAAALGTTVVSSGSGFFVSSSGHLLTNHHVIDGCIRSSVQIRGEPEVDASVIASNEEADLALLKTSVSPAASAVFRGGRMVRQGEEIVVYGFPFHDELSSQGNLTNGLVVAMSGLSDDLAQMQLSAPVQSGNSGGPVMDRAGNIVGMVVASIDGEDVQNINFAVHASLVEIFMTTNNVDYAVGTTEGTLSIADIGEQAQDFTALILCYQ